MAAISREPASFMPRARNELILFGSKNTGRTFCELNFYPHFEAHPRARHCFRASVLYGLVIVQRRMDYGHVKP